MIIPTGIITHDFKILTNCDAKNGIPYIICNQYGVKNIVTVSSIATTDRILKWNKRKSFFEFIFIISYKIKRIISIAVIITKIVNLIGNITWYVDPEILTSLILKT